MKLRTKTHDICSVSENRDQVINIWCQDWDLRPCQSWVLTAKT